ncbi:MAG: hypothetical protein AB1480_10970 [Nitrospirota bacterium]
MSEGTAKKERNFNWLLTLLISLLMSLASILVYDRFFVQKIVAFDIKGYIAEQRELYISGKINEEQLKANIDKMEKAVMSIPKNKVIIMGDAVIRNAEVVRP